MIHANTPSYVGSHVSGFAAMTAAMVKYFAQRIEPPRRAPKTPSVNVVPGFVDPSDMREIRRLVNLVGLRPTMFPDTSGVLDAPQTGHHHFYPKGGVTVEELQQGIGRGVATLALGRWASREAAVAVEDRCGVPREILDLPIGIAATDRMIGVLRTRGGEVPAELVDERGRLVDLMGDMHQHFYGKKVAGFGDPDHVIALTEFLLDLNMRPVHILTGTPGKAFDKRIAGLLGDRAAGVNFRSNADLFTLHQWIKNEPVDLLIGNTYGKYIARAQDIPFVRYGWPVLDRIGHGYFPTVGYQGALRLGEKILDALLDRRDRDSPDEQFELVL